MKKLNIGIVGAGRIGKVHAASITYHIPQAQVVRVTDVIGDAAKVGNLRTVIWGAWDVCMKI